jgi:hypothetical protein
MLYQKLLLKCRPREKGKPTPVLSTTGMSKWMFRVSKETSPLLASVFCTPKAVLLAWENPKVDRSKNMVNKSFLNIQDAP